MSSIFSKIINREIPAHIVAEDEAHIAFLDINPLKNGHTLVVPKPEIDYVFDMNPEKLAQLHVFAQKVAHSIEKVIKCERIGVTIIGLEVPHVHIHLIPIDSIDDMNFNNPKLKLTKQEFESIASEIRHSF